MGKGFPEQGTAHLDSFFETEEAKTPRIVLVDASTLGTPDVRILTSSEPVHISNIGRFGLALVNTELLPDTDQTSN
ncbi:MAG: hypothetical protein WC498_01875 [Candidatus Saccharimonadales bacterium]